MALKRLIGELHRRSIWQVIAGYLIFAWLLFETFEVLRVSVGLPDWVEPAAAILLIVLLPAVLATGSIQKGKPLAWPRLVTPREPSGSPREPLAGAAGPSKRARPIGEPVVGSVARAEDGPARGGGPRDPGVTRERPRTVSDVLTWRNTLVGGVGAFALLALVTAVYMILRAAGIGPAGTLVAQGTLDERESLILADFAGPPDLGDLATTITEGLRIDLAQSPTVRLHPQRSVGAALARMELEPDATLDMELAREVAVREAVRAVVGGSVSRLGSGYVLTAEVVLADDGSVLVSRRANARDAEELVRAVDDLSKKLRERIGEPLASIGRADPLERVTTSDLEALQKYSRAVRAIDIEGTPDRGLALLEEAVELEPAFAMAWRKLGIALNNRGEERGRIVEALTQAYQNRDRLTPRERDLATAAYFSNALGDTRQAMAAYRSLLDRVPDEGTALNNLGVAHLELRETAPAVELFHRALELDSTATIPFTNLIWAYGDLGDFAAALDHIESYPWLIHDPTAREHEAQLWASRGEYAEARRRLRSLHDDQTASPYWRTQTTVELAALAATQGRLAEAERHLREAMASNLERGLPRQHLVDAARLAGMKLLVEGDPAAALLILDFAMSAQPLDSLSPLDRPYLEIAEVYAQAGRVSDARQLLNRFESDVSSELRSAAQRIALDRIGGALDLAGGDPAGAIEATRRADRGVCLLCALPQLARAFEAAGQPDSAVATYARYVTTPFTFRARDVDPWHLGPIHERLGELYAAAGDDARAAEHFTRLARLWAEADPELQDRVERARRQAVDLLAASDRPE